MLRTLFFSFIAVALGVFIGTVPVGGRTVADRIVAAFQSTPGSRPAAVAAPAPATRRPPQKPAVQVQKKVAAATAPPPAAGASSPKPAAPTGPVTAGAANAPDQHGDVERESLNQIIAARARGR